MTAVSIELADKFNLWREGGDEVELVDIVEWLRSEGYRVVKLSQRADPPPPQFPLTRFVIEDEIL